LSEIGVQVSKKSPSKRTQIRNLAISGVLFAAILGAIIQRAIQARDDGDVERAESILLGTAAAVGSLVISGIVLVAFVYFMYQPVKRNARRLRSMAPESLVFMVSAPAHQGSSSLDNLNAPEIVMTFALGAAFSADADGLKWWSGRDLTRPRGSIPSSRIISVREAGRSTDGATQLVVELREPVGIKRLTVINEDSNGFKLRPPTGIRSLANEIEAALGLAD